MNCSDILLQIINKNLVRRILLMYFICNNSFTVYGQTSDIIRFDDLQNGPDLVSKLYSKGLVFPHGTYIYKKNDSHIGLISANPETEFNQGPLTIEFRSLKSKVQFVGGAFSAPNTTATLKAFDANGRLIATVGPTNVSNDFPATQFKIELQNPIIKKIEFEIPGFDFEIIDDLITEGSSNNNLPPTTLPAVNITSCKIIPESYSSEAKLLITGIVSGDQLGPTAKIVIDYKHSPSDFSGSTTSTTNLIKNQNKQYTFSFQQFNPSLGPLKISVVVQNLAGMLATQSIDITNIPKQVRDRVEFLTQLYPLSPPGRFLWASNGGINKLYVFEHAALNTKKITNLNSKQVKYDLYDVIEPILSKYLTTVDKYHKLKLGFPLNSPAIIPDGHGGNIGHIQNFQDGTIYESSLGIFFVPDVFRNAINDIGNQEISPGGVLKIGFPMMDPIYPTGSIANDYTWLFQRFAPIVVGGIPSTLEIKGQQPKLIVERQGGNKARYFQSYTPSAAPSIPTIFDEFNCSGIYGPCTITIPQKTKLINPSRFCKNGISYQERVTTDLNGLAGAGDQATKLEILAGRAIKDGGLSDYLGKEWPAIQGDNNLTSLFGIVSETELSSFDLPLSHSAPGAGLECLGDYTSLIPGGTAIKIFEALLKGEDAATFCPSDYNIRIQPFKMYENLLGQNQPSIKAEIEDYFFRPFRYGYGDPLLGDACYTAGRWVIDCGHPAFNTEIHPPAVVAYMRGENYDNRNATLGNVWVNNFYTGDEIIVNIYPPPRPSANARLKVVSEREKIDSSLISVEESLTPGYLKLRIRGTIKGHHLCDVTPYGELKWSLGGGYFRGKFHVYWEE